MLSQEELCVRPPFIVFINVECATHCYCWSDMISKYIVVSPAKFQQRNLFTPPNLCPPGRLSMTRPYSIERFSSFICSFHSPTHGSVRLVGVSMTVNNRGSLTTSCGRDEALTVCIVIEKSPISQTVCLLVKNWAATDGMSQP